MKVCPKCRRKQTDIRLIKCSGCDEIYIEADQIVSTFTREELKEIASFLVKDWRVLIGVVAVLVFGVWGSAAWIGQRVKAEVQEIQSEASNQLAKAYFTATNQISSQFENFRREATNSLAAAQTDFSNHVAAEFETPKIRQTVEEVAENQARYILESNVQPVVQSFRNDAEFVRLASRAFAYDFPAYSQLIHIAQQQGNTNAQFAQEVVDQVNRSITGTRDSLKVTRRLFAVVNGTNLYAGPFSSDEYAAALSHFEQTDPLNRESLINSLIELNQPLFLHQLVGLVTNEEDVLVADRIVQAISGMTHQDFHIGDLNVLARWWEINGTNYGTWPADKLNTGLALFSKMDYGAALTNFEDVLAVDPSADLDRASAILCCFEISRTNEAQSLMLGFKDKGTRWARLASVKAELEAGSVSNATAHLYALKVDYPFLQINESDDIWRKIDHAQFDRMR